MGTMITPSGGRETEVSSFERFALHVPFVQRARYMMLKMALEHEDDFPSLCAKAGLKRWRMRKFFFAAEDITLRPVAEWAWACGRELEFSAVERKEAQ